MADSKYVQFLELVYSRVDRQVRDILKTFEPPTQEYEFLIQFDGAGSALVQGMAGQGEVPSRGRIVGARILAGRNDPASSATITVWFGTFSDYPEGTLLHGSGAVPTLSSAVKANLSVDGWFQYLSARDVLAWQLTSFSGSAQHLTLALLVRRLPFLSQTNLVDGAGAELVTVSGDRVVLRG